MPPAPQPATAPTGTAHPAVDVPTRGRWSVFAVVAIGLLMASMDQTAVATALPTIGRELDVPLAWGSWTITVYALGQIVALPVAGRLAEQFGPKRVFLVAIAAFTVASLVCGLAANVGMLIAARAVQGLVGGAILPSASGIVADRFGRDRDRALGLFSSVFPLGAIVGPILGGVLVTYSGWRSIFLINLLPGILLCGLGLWLITDLRERSARQQVDVLGIALLTTGFLTGMAGVTLLGTDPGRIAAGDPATIGALLLAVLAAVLFLRHARRRPDAVVPMRLLRGQGMGTMNAINVLFGVGVVGFSALVPLYAEQRYGLVPLAAATLLTARAVGMMCTSGLSVLLLRRLGHRPLVVIGFLLLVAGFVLFAMPAVGPPQVWLTLAAGVTGLGVGLASPAANNASLHLVPGEVAASTGLRGMFRQTGGIVAISVTTAILTTSTDPGHTQAWIFVGVAVLLAVVVPLAFRVPNHRGAW
ncbi:MFS transporter [Pseudonocardia sp. CNS-139]|nr:MFS transporter [Pseudonocardia sp. CNS-139]